MMRAILFDFDGVLTVDKTGSASVISYLAQHTDIPAETVKRSYYKYNKMLLTGRLTHEEIWPDFCRDLGAPIDYRMLMEAFEHTALDDGMFEYFCELREYGFLIGMITDNKSDRIRTILKHRQYEHLFNSVAISAERHSCKDGAEIFLYVLEELCVSPSECVFIDNSEKNLIVPRELGMNTILFDDENRDAGKFREELEKVLGR